MRHFVGIGTSLFFTAVFCGLAWGQTPEINPALAPVIHPTSGSNTTTLTHQQYFRGERELFGYHPRYIPMTITFDADNRPYICTAMYASGHDFYADNYASLAVIQTLDDRGNWIQLNTFLPAIKAKYPTWDGQFSAGCEDSMHPVFDSSGDAYLLVNTYWHLGFNCLLYSRDKCRTWTVYSLPSTYYFTQMELPDGNNDRNNPPVITAMPYGWSGDKIDLIVPAKGTNNNLILPVVHIATADQLALHTTLGNVTATKGNLVHVVFVRNIPSPDNASGAPQYVVTYNRDTNAVSAPVFLGANGINVDVHNSPAITVDSQGYLHAVLGCHHQNFKYTRSLVPNSSTGGWTTPVSIGRPNNGAGWTYVNLLCDKNNTLHIVGRYAGNGYYFGLWYIRKTASGGWEDLGPLVMPFRCFYSDWYASLQMDNRSRLFLKYLYYGDQYDAGLTTSYEINAYKAKWPWENPVLAITDPNDPNYGEKFYYPTITGHDPAMIMSDDGGTNWRIALTTSLQVYFNQTFENGLDGWTLATGSGTNPISAVGSYTYNGKTITPRTGTTFARSEAASTYKQAIRTIDPPQPGMFTGYINLLDNTTYMGMFEIYVPGHYVIVMTNSASNPGRVSYRIDSAVTDSTIPATPLVWHQVRFVAVASGLSAYWDGTPLFQNSPVGTALSRIMFGTEWSSAPAGYDDFSFTPVTGDANGDGQVNAADLSIVLAAMDGATGGAADIDGDGAVTGTDLAIVLTNMSN